MQVLVNAVTVNVKCRFKWTGTQTAFRPLKTPFTRPLNPPANVPGSVLAALRPGGRLRATLRRRAPPWKKRLYKYPLICYTYHIYESALFDSLRGYGGRYFACDFTALDSRRGHPTSQAANRGRACNAALGRRRFGTFANIETTNLLSRPRT